MADPLWKTLPDRYAACENWRGTGNVTCRWCDGNGSTVGPDRDLYGILSMTDAVAQRP